MDPQKILGHLLNQDEEGKKFLRLGASGYMVGIGALAVLVPGLLLGFLGGGFFPAGTTTDFFQAFGIVFAALGYLNYISEKWPEVPKKEVTTVVGGVFGLLALWNLMVLFWGYEIGFMIFFNFPINAGFAFFHAKQLHLI